MTSEQILLIAASLLLLSVLASKVSDRFGVPALLLFLAVGMLAGSEGPGGIPFDDAAVAQFVGVVALVLILFSGGLDTNWGSVRPVLTYGVLLATLGVVITAAIVGLAATAVLGFTLQVGLLLGAIVASTDAAAVFSILGARNLHLKGQLKPLLELESGSNDPMAVFLTIGLVRLLSQPATPLVDLALSFVLQMALGAAAGYLIGRAGLWLINHINLGFEGLYPVLSLAIVLLTFGLASVVRGNGFLAVYTAGIVLGNADFVHKRSLLRFHDGLAWLMQIAMFLTLGLLVFPSRLVPVVLPALLIAACLLFVARPISVFTSLVRSPFSNREKAFLSWVGLRGAVPIILATYPLLAGLPQAELIFNVVFFVVLVSVLIQGPTVPLAARRLHVDAPAPAARVYPLEYNPVGGLRSELKELPITAGSTAAGKAIFELGLPPSFLVVLVARGDEFLVPSGQTVLRTGDTLLALSDSDNFRQVEQRLAGAE